MRYVLILLSIFLIVSGCSTLGHKKLNITPNVKADTDVPLLADELLKRVSLNSIYSAETAKMKDGIINDISSMFKEACPKKEISIDRSATIKELWNQISYVCSGLDENRLLYIITKNLHKIDKFSKVIKNTGKDKGYLGFEIEEPSAGKFVITEIPDWSGLVEAGVKTGTELTYINNVKIESIDQIWLLSVGAVGSVVSIHDADGKKYSVVRNKMTEDILDGVTFSEKSQQHIINIYQFNHEQDRKTGEYLKSLPKGSEILIDMRNCTGGLLTSLIQTLSFFLPEKEKLFEFVDNAAEKIEHNGNYFSIVKNMIATNNVTILADKTTEAGAALFTKIMQEHGVTVKGSETWEIEPIRTVFFLTKSEIPDYGYYLLLATDIIYSAKSGERLDGLTVLPN